jgi:histidine transport system substrate-binding protein
MNKMIAAVSLVCLTASSLVGAADWSGKVLKLGVDPTYPPLEYKNQDGTLTGFGVDIARSTVRGTESPLCLG